MNQLFASAGGSPAPIKDTTTETFVTDVLDPSMSTIVLVDFWAPWCAPCRTLGPILEKIVRSTNGAVKMVKLNIDEHPEVPTQLRITSIPAVYAFKDGRVADFFLGALPESQIKAFVQRLLAKGGGARPSPIEEALEVAKQMAAEGDHRGAENIYRQILQREPQNVPALVGLARSALNAGDAEDAERIFAKIPEGEAKNPDVVSLKAALELAREAAGAKGAVRDLERTLERNPGDHQARYELAVALFAAGERQAAVDHLLHIIKADREWNEQAARKQLLKLFEAMGPTDPLTVQTRKRLSSILFS